MTDTGNSGKTDQNAVLRARVLLLGSGEPSLWARIGAYRVLAQVSPKAYLPKLVDALVERGHELRDPEVRVRLFAEAAEAARRIEAGVPGRTERLRHALNAHQGVLFALGRRAEGRAVCEELAAAGWSGRLALVLAEEGRFREAAELNERSVRDGNGEHTFWSRVEWTANLEAAGMREEALKVFGELVDDGRRKAAEQRTALAVLTWELVHQSRMFDAAGRRAEAVAARREALGVLEELAATGEPRTWSCLLSWWATLFVLSGRDAEPAAGPGAPMPPFGTGEGWSADARAAYTGDLPRLEEEAALLRADGRLAELVDVQRRITLRAVSRDGHSPYRFEERMRPFLDEGVALARRLPDDPGRLARALTDRAAYFAAARTFGPAHADFAEAVALLDRP
ncbi:hypothetical protein [Streptomyces sp. NPDC127114]|uniref:hypothetical protein n=1 Tax=Streptomyces sp. NPDC127114 TaxID=3345366 RepID=UPI00363479F8